MSYVPILTLCCLKHSSYQLNKKLNKKRMSIGILLRHIPFSLYSDRKVSNTYANPKSVFKKLIGLVPCQQLRFSLSIKVV